MVALIMGFEGNSLLRWTLGRRGFEEIGEVAAASPQDAELRFFEHRAPAASVAEA